MLLSGRRSVPTRLDAVHEDNTPILMGMRVPKQAILWQNRDAFLIQQFLDPVILHRLTSRYQSLHLTREFNAFTIIPFPLLTGACP